MVLHSSLGLPEVYLKMHVKVLNTLLMCRKHYFLQEDEICMTTLSHVLRQNAFLLK